LASDIGGWHDPG